MTNYLKKILDKGIEPAFTDQTLQQVKGIEKEFRTRVKNSIIYYGDEKRKFDVYFYKEEMVCITKRVCTICGNQITNLFRQKYCSDKCSSVSSR